jgi:drug/metabolite transporter (DMT)-like permease
MFATMALVALPGTLFPEQATSWGRAVLPLKQGWILMAALVGPCTLLTFPLMNAWQRHVGATAAGLVYCAEPVLAGLYCTFVPAGLSVFLKLDYPNEILTPRFVAGAGLITLANVALSWRRPD